MRLTRVEPVDALAVGDETLLLFESQLVRLSPLAQAIFDLAAGGASVDDLAAELERRFGAPPEGTVRAATLAAVEELVGLGVVRRDD